MGKILIKHVLLNEKIVDVLIDGNTFSNIQENIEAPYYLLAEYLNRN